MPAPYRGALPWPGAADEADRHPAGPHPGDQVGRLVDAAVVDHDHRRRVRLRLEVFDRAVQRARQPLGLVPAGDQDFEVTRLAHETGWATCPVTW